jgi:hypothetical protein
VSRDFTFAAFDEFCQRIAGGPVFTLAGYLARSTAPPPPFLILRLDVDYREAHAMCMARLAARHNLRGSFYFRHRHGAFDLEAMREIAAMDHEVGYHFETLDTCRGDFEAAECLFLDHLEALRGAGLTIRTVAAHGSPPTAPTYRSNLDLIDRSPGLLERAGVLGEATLSIDFTEVTYASDASWRWRRYDRFQPGARGKSTALGRIMQDSVRGNAGLYINFHPQQWFAHPASMLYYRTRNRLGRRLPPVMQCAARFRRG